MDFMYIKTLRFNELQSWQVIQNAAINVYVQAQGRRVF